MTGWIKIHRKILEWEWFGDEKTIKVFLYCLLKANIKDKKWRGVLIKKGSFITSVEGLGITCGFSIQSIRTILNKLKSTHELTIKTTNKYTLITVNNYLEYQSTNKQTNKRLTNHQQTTNKQLTTTKEYKNIKKKRYTDKNFSLKEVSEKLIQAFNLHLKRKFKLSSGLLPNIEYWLETYEPKEIEEAIKNIEYDDFWKDKMTPTILFRKKNPQGEPVDYISQLLVKNTT